MTAVQWIRLCKLIIAGEIKIPRGDNDDRQKDLVQ